MKFNGTCIVAAVLFLMCIMHVVARYANAEDKSVQVKGERGVKMEITGKVIKIRGVCLREDNTKRIGDPVDFRISEIDGQRIPGKCICELSNHVLESWNEKNPVDIRGLRRRQNECEITGYFNGAYIGIPTDARKYMGQAADILDPAEFAFRTWFEVLRVEELVSPKKQ